MKTTFLILLMAVALAGCSTSDSGAPPSAYETSMGQNPATYPHTSSDFPANQWRYQSIRPTSPP